MDAPQTSTTAIVDPKVQQSFEIIWLLVHAYLMFFMQVSPQFVLGTNKVAWYTL